MEIRITHGNAKAIKLYAVEALAVGPERGLYGGQVFVVIEKKNQKPKREMVLVIPCGYRTASEAQEAMDKVIRMIRGEIPGARWEHEEGPSLTI